MFSKLWAPLSAAVGALLVAGCAKSSVIPIAADTVHITTSAAPVCGRTGAQDVAVRRAAIETIKLGFDKFVVVGAGYQNNVRVVGHTPIVATTTGTATATGYGNTAYATGSSMTTYSGGQPIVGGAHDQGLTIKMFKDGDPLGANAVSARQSLGPDWKKVVEAGSGMTC
jgi:hypothetical protein